MAKNIREAMQQSMVKKAKNPNQDKGSYTQDLQSNTPNKMPSSNGLKCNCPHCRGK